jgi:hypothetical protein
MSRARIGASPLGLLFRIFGELGTFSQAERALEMKV